MPEELTPETEIENGVGRTLWPEADNLDEYEFDLGDRFVRWHPWGNERADEDVWTVVNLSWTFRTSWITDRDNPSTKSDHRQYHLRSKETMDEQTVAESDLTFGDWRPLDEVEGVEE